MTKHFTFKLLAASMLTLLAVVPTSISRADARGGGGIHAGGGGRGGGGGSARPARGGLSFRPSGRGSSARRNNFHNNNLAHRYYGGYRRGWGGYGYGGYGYGGYGGNGYNSGYGYGEPYLNPADGFNQSEDRRRQSLPTSAFIHEYHWPSHSGSQAASTGVPPSHANELGALHNVLPE